MRIFGGDVGDVGARKVRCDFLKLWIFFWSIGRGSFSDPMNFPRSGRVPQNFPPSPLKYA